MINADLALTNVTLTHRALRHLAWADDNFFAALEQLPDAAFQARYAAEHWPVGELAVHIVGGAEWYRYCLTGEPWTDLREPTCGSDVTALRTHLAELNAALLHQADQPDGVMTFADEDGPRTALRSTILAQACLHAAEHRAQIACALDAAGFASPCLDDLDLWAFEKFQTHQNQ